LIYLIESQTSFAFQLADPTRVEVDVGIYLILHPVSFLICVLDGTQQTPGGQGHGGHQGSTQSFSSRRDLLLNLMFLLASDEPGLMGKVKHAYEDVKGKSGGQQQGGGSYGQSQGGGDNLF
jgi:hypothetical protein